MKRLLSIAAVLAVISIPSPMRATAGADPDKFIVSGSALAASAVAIGNVNPNVDFWPIYSTSSIDNEISHGLSGAMWPGFLVDAFFWLYGFQPIERAALGISESQFPSLPHATEASSSAFVMSNFADGCRFLFGSGGAATEACKNTTGPFINRPPGTVGSSGSRSGDLTSDGWSQATKFVYPSVLEAGSVKTSTSSKFVDGHTVTEAKLVASDVSVANLRIASLTATSVAIATAKPGANKATSSVSLAGVTYGGQSATVDDSGVHLTADRAADGPNQTLAAQGLQVRLVQGTEKSSPDGQTSSATSGGLTVRISRERAEEAFPAPVREARLAACAAAANSPLSQEITRIRVSQPDPLFGRVPFAPLPERFEVDQSVFPPASCPFVNRGFDVGLAIGMTNASSRLSALPEEISSGSVLGNSATTSYVTTVEPGSTTSATTSAVVDPSGVPAEKSATPRLDSTHYAAAFTEADVSRRVASVYLGLILALAGLVFGRGALKRIFQP